MLSIPNRAAVCLAGVALSGCMQSMPSAEVITKPTMEAFTRLSSWQPWQAAPAPAPEPIIAQALPERSETASIAEPKSMRAVERRPSDRPRAAAKPQLAARTVPIAPPVTPEAVIIPAKVTCHTSNVPGERVRMECIPVEAGQ